MLVGTGAAAADQDFLWWAALLPFVVSITLQVGVNYANDYSDGIRGTDTDPGRTRSDSSDPARPHRPPSSVPPSQRSALRPLAVWCSSLRRERLNSFSSALPASLPPGTTPVDGDHGYRGFGELSVFVFFGLVAVIGTTYVQSERVTTAAVVGGVGVVHSPARSWSSTTSVTFPPTPSLGSARSRWCWATGARASCSPRCLRWRSRLSLY